MSELNDSLSVRVEGGDRGSHAAGEGAPRQTVERETSRQSWVNSSSCLISDTHTHTQGGTRQGRWRGQTCSAHLTLKGLCLVLRWAGLGAEHGLHPMEKNPVLRGTLGAL